MFDRKKTEAAASAAARPAATGSVETVVLALDPIPDFLEDHTLVSEDLAGRLREHSVRWAQFVAGLWNWRRRAAFCLRFVAPSGDGRIHVFLLASATDRDELAALWCDLFQRLKLQDVPCRGAVKGERELAFTVPSGPGFEVHQHVEGLAGTASPKCVFPWWGPGGPFLLPMACLVGLEHGGTLSVYVEPTELEDTEREWLMHAVEQSSRGATREKATAFGGSSSWEDPRKALTARLLMANYRRLVQAPFLVSAHCHAGDRTGRDARRLASSLEALSREAPFVDPFKDDERLPSGSTLTVLDGERDRAARVRFNELFAPSTDRDAELGRLQYLADAQGASTLFRLPVSVRGGVPGLRIAQQPPDFHPGPRRGTVAGTLTLGRFHAGDFARIPLQDLKQHVLATGFTGSGKTNTVQFLLDQLWARPDLGRDPLDEERIPFLVIESAKTEYRGLMGVPVFAGERADGGGPTLSIYTVGNELCAPMRINPFELFPGVRMEAHLGRLLECFAAVVPWYGAMPALIGDAIELAYAEKGWLLTDVGPDEPNTTRPFPTLSEVVAFLDDLLEPKDPVSNPRGRGYTGEMLQNMRGYINSRIRPLLIGSRGRMFAARSTAPRPEDLFRFPAIVELGDLNQEDKALVTLFLLTMLREYRELHPSAELCHVSVVEEAHNVLAAENAGSKHIEEASAGTKTVEAFCRLLTEVRALGEGLVIVDQSPEKLAPDAMRNTNLQIAHQLRDSHDREAIARAMLMTEEQAAFVGKLEVGQAATFFTGLEKASFIRVPPYLEAGKIPDTWKDEDDRDWDGRGAGFVEDCSHALVREHMRALIEPLLEGPFGVACAPCDHKCALRERVVRALSFDDHVGFCVAEEPDALRAQALRVGRSIARSLGPLDGVLPRDVALCTFVHLTQANVAVRGGSGGEEGLERMNRIAPRSIVELREDDMQQVALWFESMS